MKNKIQYALFGVVLMLAFTVYAEHGGKSSADWEQHLAQKKQMANEELNRRIQEIESKFAQKGNTPELQKLKENEIAFQRQKTSEFLSFVDTLKNMSETERKGAWERFNMEQKSKHEAFRSQQEGLWKNAYEHKKK